MTKKFIILWRVEGGRKIIAEVTITSESEAEAIKKAFLTVLKNIDIEVANDT